MATESEALILNFLGDPLPQLRWAIVHKLLFLVKSGAPSMADEVYLQLCEHLHRGGSSEKIWQLIAICLSSFPPNQTPLELYMSGELLNKQGLYSCVAVHKCVGELASLVAKCSLQLSKVLRRGSRKTLPSKLEIECTLDGDPVPLRVRFFDEWVAVKVLRSCDLALSIFQVNSHSTVLEVVQQLEKQLDGRVPPKYFALFECSPSNQEHILEPNDCILDVMNRWASQLCELFVSFADLPIHPSLVSIVFEYFSASDLLQLLPHAPDTSTSIPTSHNWSCDWREAIDTVSGRKYYYDRKSKMTSWVKPNGAVAIPQNMQGWLNGTLESKRVSLLDPAASRNLAEWREATDSNTNKTYYYNTVTKKTSWAPPENYFSPSISPEPFTHFLFKIKPLAKIPKKCHDAVCLQLRFRQTVSDVVTHRYPSVPGDLPYLSAVQLQALDGDFKVLPPLCPLMVMSGRNPCPRLPEPTSQGVRA